MEKERRKEGLQGGLGGLGRRGVVKESFRNVYIRSPQLCVLFSELFLAET